MLVGLVTVLACLSARTSLAAETHPRAHIVYNNKDLTSILASIDEKLRLMDTISAMQLKQARRIDVIQDKLDRVESTIALKLERVQLKAETLEHRLHMLQTTVETSIQESIEKQERSQNKITEVAQNLNNHLDSHKHLLEKVSGAYTETWRRGLLLESLVRDGLALINVTRREFADGLRSIRRHRDSRLVSADIEAAFSKRLSENTHHIDLKMQKVLETQKGFIDSCQRAQRDDPTNVTNALDKVIVKMVDKTIASFRELQNIHTTMRNHDNKVIKMLSTGRNTQSETVCKRLEVMLLNSTYSLKENELQKLTEKFIALTDQADAALQKLESRLSDDQPLPASDVTSEADQLMNKLKGIKSEQENENDDFDDDEDDAGYFDDDNSDIMDEDRLVLAGTQASKNVETTTAGAIHRRHLHKHPYDRGPTGRMYQKNKL